MSGAVRRSSVQTRASTRIERPTRKSEKRATVSLCTPMRHIAVRPAAHDDEMTFIAPTSVGAARGLHARFPTADLRPVALVRASTLDRRADPTERTRIWIACESLQVTGSFKVRGALWALHHAQQQGCTAVVASSAGNHGVGVARAAVVLEMRATIVVPRDAPRTKLARMVRDGATLVEVDGTYDTTEQVARLRATERGETFISPYDNLEVLTGNGSSIAFEIVNALGRVPDRVLVPIGGGGLATGLAWGLAASSGEDPRLVRRVWTVQSESSPAFALSVEREHALETYSPTAPTLAEGLEGGISQRAFLRASAVVAGVTIVSETHIAEAMAWAYASLGLQLEGSAAVALVPALRGLPESTVGGDIVVVVTGRNIDSDVFDRVVHRPRLVVSYPDT